MSDAPAIDYVEISKEQTARANLAEWRISALKTTSRGLMHMRESYTGDELKLAQIMILCDSFNSFYDAEIKKLEKIAEQARYKAARALELHNTGEK